MANPPQQNAKHLVSPFQMFLNIKSQFTVIFLVSFEVFKRSLNPREDLIMLMSAHCLQEAEVVSYSMLRFQFVS